MVRRLIILAMLAGCAGESTASETPASATDQTTSTAAPTTVAPTASTSTTSSTVAPTTSTTVAPTTTLDPVTQIAADIERDLNLGEQAFLAAGADPSSPALRAEMDRYFDGQPLAIFSDFLDTLVTNGYVVRRNPDIPAINVIVGPVEVDDISNPTKATARVCRIDSGIVVQPIGSGDIEVSGGTARYVTLAQLAFVDDVWMITANTSDQETPGATTCDA